MVGFGFLVLVFGGRLDSGAMVFSVRQTASAYRSAACLVLLRETTVTPEKTFQQKPRQIPAANRDVKVSLKETMVSQYGIF